MTPARGLLYAAAALLAAKAKPTDADIDAAMAGNICRCGTYPRIREAIKAGAKEMPMPKKAKPKPKRRGWTSGDRRRWKKAVVTLHPEDSIELFEGQEVSE